MRLPNWNLLIAFEAVARHGNFTRAAEELNVLQPAISRRVSLLEKEVGVRLINRKRPTATLTVDGQILFRAIAGSIAQVQMAVQQIQPEPTQKTLVINTTIGFANCFLMRKLNSFRSRYPDITVELRSRDINEAYDTRSSDLVTVFDSPDRIPGIAHEKIFGERMIAVCAPEYLQNNPVLDNQLIGHPLLQLPVGIHGDDWHNYLAGINHPPLQPSYEHRYTSFMVYLQAALNGEGIAIGWEYLLDELLASGQLIKALDHTVSSERGYFCCLTKRAHNNNEARRFMQWCTELVNQH